jgi:hypothetical protein
MTLQYSGEIPSNSAIVAAAEQIAALYHSKSPGPTTVEIAAVIGGNLRAARSKATRGDRSDGQLSNPQGSQSTYAWAYLAHARERRDYDANTIAKMCPDDPDRHLRGKRAFVGQLRPNPCSGYPREPHRFIGGPRRARLVASARGLP